MMKCGTYILSYNVLLIIIVLIFPHLNPECEIVVQSINAENNIYNNIMDRGQYARVTSSCRHSSVSYFIK